VKTVDSESFVTAAAAVQKKAGDDCVGTFRYYTIGRPTTAVGRPKLSWLTVRGYAYLFGIVDEMTAVHIYNNMVTFTLLATC
jgi:hypothetical protein